MMHLSQKRYTAMATEGLFRMPTTLHVAYCGLSGLTWHDVDTLEKHVDCDECFQAKAWGEIDAMEVVR